jgi:hypothetical protein
VLKSWNLYAVCWAFISVRHETATTSCYPTGYWRLVRSVGSLLCFLYIFTLTWLLDSTSKKRNHPDVKETINLFPKPPHIYPKLSLFLFFKNISLIGVQRRASLLRSRSVVAVFWKHKNYCKCFFNRVVVSISQVQYLLAQKTVI